MFLRILTTSLKWLLSLGLLGGLLFGLYLIREMTESERSDDDDREPRVETQQARQDFVSLEEDEAERYGLAGEAARSIRWYPRVAVYGRVVPNPQAAAEVRSPFAGTLRAARGTPWPALGQRVRAGQTLAWVDIRVGPEVRLDMQNKLADARIRQRGAEEEIKIEQDRADSLRRVTSQEIIARGELDTALIHLAQARTQLATARASVELWRKALEEIDKRPADADSSWSWPLTAPADGEVADLSGRLGMAVESGTLVLALVDFGRPLVRLDIPPDVFALGGPPRQVELRVPSTPPPALSGVLNPNASAPASLSAEAQLVGPASRVDATSQFVSYWYGVRLASPRRKGGESVPEESEARRILWRPGMQVMAEMRASEAAAQPVAVVPAGAVLYHQGRSLVYVRIGPEKFQRREVRLLGREGERWVLAVRQGNLAIGVTPGETVVSRQAQLLLSKEFLVGSADDD